MLLRKILSISSFLYCDFFFFCWVMFKHILCFFVAVISVILAVDFDFQKAQFLSQLCPAHCIKIQSLKCLQAMLTKEKNNNQALSLQPFFKLLFFHSLSLILDE